MIFWCQFPQVSWKNRPGKAFFAGTNQLEIHSFFSGTNHVINRHSSSKNGTTFFWTLSACAGRGREPCSCMTWWLWKVKPLQNMSGMHYKITLIYIYIIHIYMYVYNVCVCMYAWVIWIVVWKLLILTSSDTIWHQWCWSYKVLIHVALSWISFECWQITGKTLVCRGSFMGSCEISSIVCMVALPLLLGIQTGRTMSNQCPKHSNCSWNENWDTDESQKFSGKAILWRSTDICK